MPNLYADNMPLWFTSISNTIYYKYIKLYCLETYGNYLWILLTFGSEGSINIKKYLSSIRKLMKFPRDSRVSAQRAMSTQQKCMLGSWPACEAYRSTCSIQLFVYQQQINVALSWGPPCLPSGLSGALTHI